MTFRMVMLQIIGDHGHAQFHNCAELLSVRGQGMGILNLSK